MKPGGQTSKVFNNLELSTFYTQARDMSRRTSGYLAEKHFPVDILFILIFTESK